MQRLKRKVFKTERHRLGFSLICGLMLQAAPGSAKFAVSFRYGFICVSVYSLQEIRVPGVGPARGAARVNSQRVISRGTYSSSLIL